MIDKEYLDYIDYYKTYCELTIWFKKIVLYSNNKATITVKDIAGEFITERNRILSHVPADQRLKLKKNLNRVATSYHSRIRHWSRSQKIAVDMV